MSSPFLFAKAGIGSGYVLVKAKSALPKQDAFEDSSYAWQASYRHPNALLV